MLGRWGIGGGPYWVIPFVGPSGPRDAVGLVLDTALNPPTWLLPGSGALALLNGRAQLVKNLIDAGFVDKILLGHDYSVPRGQITQKLRKQSAALNPDGYLFITRHVLPRLKELGVSDAEIDRVMVQNPRKFFEGG